MTSPHTFHRFTVSPNISPTDAALIIISTPSRSIADYGYSPLLEVIRSDANTWITKDRLFTVALRLLALFHANPILLTGEYSALFTRRLLQEEQGLGGPYNDGTDMLATNAMIFQLFAAFGKPLPNVTNFLNHHLTTHPDSLNAYWPLRWPHPFSNYSSTASSSMSVSPLANESHTVLAQCLQITHHHAVQPVREPNTVARDIEKELRAFDPHIHTTARILWEAVSRADATHEISMLSYYFSEALSIPHTLTERHIMQLGRANFYTWMAYSAYDDIIDQDDPGAYLSIANISQRAALRNFSSVALYNKQPSEYIDRYFDHMDTANAWELQSCRFSTDASTITVKRLPTYRSGMVLAKRAYAHTLGPIVILEHTPYVSTAQKRVIRRGLDHYLIARQLSDDIHDWRDDILAGHISYVVAYLLRELRIRPGTYILSDLIERMQRLFWNRGLEGICEIILHHATLASEYVSSSGLLLPDTEFEQITTQRIARSAHESRAVLASQKQFLTTFSSNTLL